MEYDEIACEYVQEVTGKTYKPALYVRDRLGTIVGYIKYKRLDKIIVDLVVILLHKTEGYDHEATWWLPNRCSEAFETGDVIKITR